MDEQARQSALEMCQRAFPGFSWELEPEEPSGGISYVPGMISIQGTVSFGNTWLTVAVGALAPFTGYLGLAAIDGRLICRTKAKDLDLQVVLRELRDALENLKSELNNALICADTNG